jgi:hypothetical protein
VLDVILVQTAWAESFTLDTQPPEEFADGFVFFFEIPPTSSGETGGSLYLRRDGPVLHAVTLLTGDYQSVADAWQQTLESYTTTSQQLAEQPPASETTPAGDSRFLPEQDGFSFANYGNENEPVNLTPVEVQRMFGDVVCASMSGGECTLTPPARSWMDEVNAMTAALRVDGGAQPLHTANEPG